MIKKTLFLLSQFVDDVEFWFPPGKKSIVEYRSASRVGNYDFDINRKRIKVSILSTLVLFLSLHSHHLCDKQINGQSIDRSLWWPSQALRLELEKKGWGSEDSF